MSDVKKYVILVDNSIAKFGRYLKKGDVIELEERQAHTDFAGRVAPEDNPTKATAVWEESTAGLTAFDRELKLAGMRAHERVQVLEVRKVNLTRQLAEVERLLEQANVDLKADEKKIQERHAQIARNQPPVPAVQPSAPPAEPTLGTSQQE
jgi:hypothetical protein